MIITILQGPGEGHRKIINKFIDYWKVKQRHSIYYRIEDKTLITNDYFAFLYWMNKTNVVYYCCQSILFFHSMFGY